jgi:fibronectin-binding autotransporter adhesin
MDLSKRTGIGFLFAPTGAAVVLCALMSAMSAAAGTNDLVTNGTTTGILIAAKTGGTLNLRSGNIIPGAEFGSFTFGNDTVQETQDVTSLLAIDTAGAGHTALFNAGVGKILQDASVLGKNDDPLLFNSGSSIQSGSGSNETGSTIISAIPSLPEIVMPSPSNFAFTGGILEFGNSNFTRAFGAGVRQVNMNNASADFAAFGADRLVDLGASGTSVQWVAGNDALASGSIIGTSTGMSTASTYAIQSDTGSPILAGPSSNMTKTMGGTDALTAIRTWDGAFANGKWSKGGNWGGTAPVGGDSLAFGGNLHLTDNNNDLAADTSFAGITFNSGAGAFTLGGLRITLGGDVTNLSTNLQTISLDMILSANRTFTTLTGGGNLTIGGILSESGGAHGITKAGAGTLTLSGVNTYTGVTTISAGTLSVSTIGNGGVAGNLGQATNAAANLVFDGGTLQYTGVTASTDRSFTINTGKTATFDITTNTLTVSGASTATNGALTKTGTGTLTLSGANTYTGATTVSAGILKAGVVSVANTSGAFGNNSAVTLANIAGVALDITGFNTQIGSLTGGGATGGNVTLGAATLTTGGDNTSPAAYAGVISGSGGVTKIGTGIWTVSGANTYTGATTISAGVLNVQNNTGLGTIAGGTTVSNGATMQFQNGVTIGNEALNIRGTGAAGQTGALVNVSGTNTYGGLLSLAGATTLSSDSGTLNLTNAGTITGATFGLTLAGAGNGSVSSIIGTTSGSLTKNGTGTWTLSGANTFTGTTTVNGGTLVLANGSGSALGATSAVTVNSGGTLFLGANNQINNTATITLNGGTFAKGNFSEGSASTAGAGALNLTAAGSHLDFGSGTVGDLTFASFAPGANTLTIDNWTGTFGTVGTEGLTDRLIFASDQSGNLGSFNFTGFGPGSVEFNLGNGYFEIVPVPEAGTYFSGSIVLALILLHHRKQLRRLFHRESPVK